MNRKSNAAALAATVFLVNPVSIDIPAMRVDRKVKTKPQYKSAAQQAKRQRKGKR